MTEPNPLLEGLKLPGKIFQLPSRGIFYHNGELDDTIKDGEIHVHAMSALDEINMKNPDQLFSGAAVNTVFTTCVNGVNKPSELLSKDVDAIMLYLRTVTYGSEYEFMAHHGCGEFDGVIKPFNDYTYTTNIDRMIENMKMIDPTLVDSMYTVNLPNGQTVKLRPNKYQQVLTLIRENQNKKELSVEDQQNNLIMMLLGVIESVDGHNDPTLIEGWIRKAPTRLINRIAEKIEKINNWGPDLKAECVCKDCGVPYFVDIPINPVSFFNE